MSLAKRAAAEAIGTAFLLLAVVGSGIMAQRLAGGNVAIALLANTIVTGGALVALIATFGPISGAHFNPAVTVADALLGRRPWTEAPWYVSAQVCGAVAGVVIANSTFGLVPISLSHHERSGAGQIASEFIATFGLLAVIWGCSKFHQAFVPVSVACYIVAAYWFTPSTSFANPAVTLARSLSDTFAGIRPADIAPFVVAQFAGALCATALFAWFAAPQPESIP